MRLDIPEPIVITQNLMKVEEVSIHVEDLKKDFSVENLDKSAEVIEAKPGHSFRFEKSHSDFFETKEVI